MQFSCSCCCAPDPPPASQITAVISTSKSNFENLFKFKSPACCITASCISNLNEYAVDTSNWNKNSAVLYSNSIVNTNNIGGNNYLSPTIKYDYVRHIASSVTGGLGAVDLFSNETELKTSVIDLDDDLDVFIKNKLEELGGTLSSPITDLSNNLVRNSVIVPLLNSMQCCRIMALFTPNRDITQWMSIPFKVGDIIQFEINYAPTNSTPLGNNVIDTRTYTMQILLTE